MIILGLSRRNVELLIGGQPTMLTPETHKLPEGLEIVIFFGETEEVMTKEVQRVTTIDKIIDYRKKEN